MDQINEQLDVVSERLITLDGSPFSTLREFAENTKLKMKLVTGTALFQNVWKISSRLPLLSRPYAKGIEVSGEEGDDCTQDIFIANKTDIEKIFGCYKPNLAKRLVLTHNLKQLPKPLTLTLAVFLFKRHKK